jgi:hypothetical protein
LFQKYIHDLTEEAAKEHFKNYLSLTKCCVLTGQFLDEYKFVLNSLMPDAKNSILT